MKKEKLFAAVLSLSFALGAISPVFADSDKLWTIEELIEENNRRAEEIRKAMEEYDYEESIKPSEKPNPPKKEDQASSGQVVDDGPCSEKGGPSIEKGGSEEVEKLSSVKVETEPPKEMQPKEPMVKLAKAKKEAEQNVKTANFLMEKYPNTVRNVRSELEKLIKEAEELIRKANELLAKHRI